MKLKEDVCPNTKMFSFRKRVQSIVFAVFAISLCSISVSNAQVSGTVGLLKGDVHATDGSTVSGINIAIYKGTERISATKSTNEGKFQAILKPDATYRIAFISTDYGYHEDTLVVPSLEKYQEFPVHSVLMPLREGQSFSLDNPVFLPKSASIDNGVRPQLENIITLMRHNAKLSVAVTVYPDAVIKSKKDASQSKLVESRATAVRSFFLGQNIPSDKITVMTATTVPPGRFTAHQVDEPVRKGKKAAKPGLIPQYIEIVAHLAS